ncbi:kinase-like protein, partial [Rozella allomycis CSF55]
KMIDLDSFERNQIDTLRKEIQVMSLCKHPNVLPVYASFLNSRKLWIVTPLMQIGSCLDVLKNHYPDGLEEGIIACILYQALQGLDYLHKNNHIHRDFKAGNLLMDRYGTVYLADFGVSSSLMEDFERKGIRKTFVGTPCWMAPEVMEMTKGYDTKADIWSVGITALELAYGFAPFAKFPPMKVIYLTLNNQAPTLDKNHANRKYSKAFKEMIDCCLQKDPTKRPTCEALLKHSFFKQIKKSSGLEKFIEGLSTVEERAKKDFNQTVYDTTDAEDSHSWDFDSVNGGDEESQLDESKSSNEGKSNDFNKKSRFILESSNADTPTKENVSEIKKGRFSVIEKPLLPSEIPKANLPKVESSESMKPILQRQPSTDSSVFSSGKRTFEVRTVATEEKSILSPSISQSHSTSTQKPNEQTRGRFQVLSIDPPTDTNENGNVTSTAGNTPIEMLPSPVVNTSLKSKVSFNESIEKIIPLPTTDKQKPSEEKSMLDGLSLISNLEKYIKSLLKENEDLKRENEALKRSINRVE